MYKCVYTYTLPYLNETSIDVICVMFGCDEGELYSAVINCEKIQPSTSLAHLVIFTINTFHGFHITAIFTNLVLISYIAIHVCLWHRLWYSAVFYGIIYLDSTHTVHHTCTHFHLNVFRAFVLLQHLQCFLSDVD